MKLLVTPQLTLEPQTRNHASEMFQLLGDPAIYIHENEPPASLEWLQQRFVRLEARQSPDGLERWLNWVVRLRDGPCIGFVQATVLTDGSATIAYVLGSAYWGRGLASEAVAAMLEELAAGYGVQRLDAVLKRSNGASLRLLQRFGFVMVEPSRIQPGDIEADEYWMCRPAHN